MNAPRPTLPSVVLAGIEITTIHELTFADPVTIALMFTIGFVATIQSLAAVGLIATMSGFQSLRSISFAGKARTTAQGDSLTPLLNRGF